MRVLLLSGGIDSAVCAALAVDAFGADRVYGVGLPSAYSSEHSLADAADLAARTGLQPESVRVNLHRGVKLLREKLGVEKRS